MRLVDFLKYLLEAQAQTLQRLAALLGEETLMEFLETVGENSTSELSLKWMGLNPEWLEPVQNHLGSSPYLELQGTVKDLRLPEFLEFHLWAYPFYRVFIESNLDLNSKIHGPGMDSGLILVNTAVSQAEAWVQNLPIPSPLKQQAEQAAKVPWLRFRAEVLKRIGKRPLGPVY